MPFSLPASHQAIIMKRDAIERLGGYDLKYKILADYDLINHAFFVGMKANRCSDMIAVFFIRRTQYGQYSFTSRTLSDSC